MERDEEIELDLDAGAKHLTGDEPPKKKTRAKARPKKDQRNRVKNGTKSSQTTSFKYVTSQSGGY